MAEFIGRIQEKSRIEGAGASEEIVETEETPLSGYCDQCGSYSEGLKDKNGQFLCEDCRIEEETEE